MRLLLTLLKIVAVSAPLTWLWIEWGRDLYGVVFAKLALPVYGFLGLTSLVPTGARDRFINYLPFLILMIVTPRLSWQRRVWGTVIGFLAIFIVHLAFVYVASSSVEPGGITREGFVRIVPANVLSDSVPFVLWVIFAREFVWQTVTKVFASPGGRPHGA